MTTIIIALLIIISAIGIPLVFILIKKNKNKKRNELFFYLLSKEGSKQGLSFSSQEILRNKMIALDGLKQVLLVFEFENTNNNIYINMAEIKDCTVEKKYDSILIGTERKAIAEPHLRSIDLKFAFKNNAEPVSVSFYDNNVNSIYEMLELEAKAKTWREMLSKMIFTELKVSA